MPTGMFRFSLKTKRLAEMPSESLHWAHSCTLEPAKKRRSHVTYALGAASASRQSKKATAIRASSARGFRKRLRPALVKTARLVATQDEDSRTEALEEMFVASRKRFLSIAYSILRNKEDAEDAVQTAFLSAYRHLRTFEGRSALRTWLTRIVMNAALMMRRKRKPSMVRSFSESSISQDDSWTENIPDSQPDPEMIYAERETFQLIDEKLGKLRPVLRQAFTMTYYDELSGSEACALLGVTSGTFKARLFLARHKLLDRTERDEVTPIRRSPASSSESWQRKGLRSLQGFAS